MSDSPLEIIGQEYSAGFVTDVESETLPPGLDESVVRFISAKKQRAGLADGLAALGFCSTGPG